MFSQVKNCRDRELPNQVTDLVSAYELYLHSIVVKQSLHFCNKAGYRWWGTLTLSQALKKYCAKVTDQ
jgi:hypothetical protein